MRRDHKHSGIGKGLIIVVESLMKLNELNHESIVGAGDGALLLDKRLSFFVVISVLKNDVSDNKGD
jgi:hypothetical protein